jgi:Ohr subfamily peroxiredoxin
LERSPSRRRADTGLCQRSHHERAVHTAQATATGGREGRVRSSDGALNLDLAIPRELGGPGGVATNPEQLFAAGFAACFENAIRLVARRRRLPIGQASVTARVGIGPTDIGGYQLEVELHAQLPDLDHDTAREIVEAAHQVCPYSNAVRGNVDVVAVVDPAPDVI